MKTIILPGFSPHNKDWAEQIASETTLGHKIVVHNWLHWKLGGGLKLRAELQSILKEIESSEVNIIAKSVGTYVAARILPLIKSQVNKIILCGIPSTSEKRKEIYLKAFKDFPEKKLVCFQNENDPFAKFEDVKKFMEGVSSEAKVVKKIRSDHDYSYFEDFQKFLK